MKSLGFTGTQEGLTREQKRTLRAIFAIPFDEYHFGDCIGADAQAHRILKKINPKAHTVGHIPSDSSKRAFLKYEVEKEPLPYLIRNRMIARSELLIACPKEPKEIRRSGTWSTVRYALENKRIVIVVLPNGACVTWKPKYP